MNIFGGTENTPNLTAGRQPNAHFYITCWIVNTPSCFAENLQVLHWKLRLEKLSIFPQNACLMFSIKSLRFSNIPVGTMAAPAQWQLLNQISTSAALSNKMTPNHISHILLNSMYPIFIEGLRVCTHCQYAQQAPRTVAPLSIYIAIYCF